MGTRSLTHIHDGGKDDPILATIYRQMDGYPTCHGEEIKQAFADREMVNGFNSKKTQVNGMGCAAALLVSFLKGDEAGSIYIARPGQKIEWEDYEYRVFKQRRVEISHPGCQHFQVPSALNQY